MTGLLTLDYGQQVCTNLEGIRCQQLWQAVLFQSLVDVTFASNAPEHAKKQAFKTMKWTETPEFLYVCELASINSDAMKKQILELYDSSVKTELIYTKKDRKPYRKARIANHNK